MNPYLDPRVVGPFIAAGNWYWAGMTVALGMSVQASLAVARPFTTWERPRP